MFCNLCRTSVLHGRQATTASQSCKLFYLLHNDPIIFGLSTALRFMSTTPNQQSFTVSYLINKFGFSPEFAMAASSHVNLKTQEKPDTVISFLKKHGFSKSQIKNLVRKEPRLLVSNVEKTLLPKLDFFLSKGFSNPDLIRFLSSYPHALERSLERCIIPFFDFLSNLVHSDEITVKVIKNYPFVFSNDINIIINNMLSNVNILRDHGVPESYIGKILYQFSRAVFVNPSRLKEIVEKVEELGLDPRLLKFAQAVNVLAGVNKSILQGKVDAYKKWGWSDKEIWECFRRYPGCLAVSEDNIMANMDFFINKMGFDSSRVINQPSILRHNFEKRIAPRGLFAQHLLSKGLIKDFKLCALFDTSNKEFLKLFVAPHVAEAPELLELYNEKFNK